MFFNKQTNPFSYTDTVSTILHFSILHFSIIHFSLFSVVKTLRDQKLFLSLFENMVPKQHFQISSVAMPTTCTNYKNSTEYFHAFPIQERQQCNETKDYICVVVSVHCDLIVVWLACLLCAAQCTVTLSQ